MPSSPAEPVTFLYADVELAHCREEMHLDTRGDSIAVLFRSVVESHGGSVFGPRDRSRIAAFESASAALVAALDLPRMLHTALPDADPEQIRIALHTGTVTCGTLRRAQQLLAATPAGQALLSQAVAALVRDHLPAGVGLRDLGSRRLKDLLYPEHLFFVEAPDRTTTIPPRTLDMYATNLPMRSTPFFGREREVAEVCGLVRRDHARAITLVAPSGIGKTRFGLQVATELLDDFADGVFFVALAPVVDPSLVASVIARALDIKEAGEPLLETLKVALRDRRMLLLLDNFEQVLGAADVTELLAAAPGLRVLATSQAPLQIDGEQAIPVPPLELPDLADLPPLDVLVRCPAVALFLERARRVQPGFAVPDQDAPALVELCAYLNGLPMALENEESLALFRALGDRWGTAVALYDLGEVLVARGDYERAKSLLAENLVLSESLGDRALMGHALAKLGEVLAGMREGARGADLLEKSLVVRRDIGDQEGIAQSLEKLAGLAAWHGGLVLAARLWGAAEALRAASMRPCRRPRGRPMSGRWRQPVPRSRRRCLRMPGRRGAR